MRLIDLARIVLPVLGLLAGCFEIGEDQCEVGSGHCADNVAVVCQPPCAEFGCGAFYVEQPCGDWTCVETEGSALCALSENEDSQCKPGARSSYCDDDSIVFCDRGYAVSTKDCATTDEACAQIDSSSAICALSSKPDLRCGNELSINSRCDGAHRLVCQDGFLVVNETCPIACAEYQDFAECSLMDGLDPLCAEGAAASDGNCHCTGDVLFRCLAEISVMGHDCASAQGVCVEDPLFGARCEFPLPPEEAAAARGEDPDANEPGRELTSSELDPRCPVDESFASACDGRTWLACQSGRATFEQRCTHGCVAFVDSFGDTGHLCALTAGSDPRCAPDRPPVTRSTLGCAGDVQYFCSGDRSLEATDCSDYGYVCVPSREGHSSYCGVPDGGASGS